MYKLISYFGEEAKTVRKYDDESKQSWIDIPFDSDNSDYQAFLKWVSEGNTPLPADE